MVTCVGALLAGADPGRRSSEASGRWSKIIRTVKLLQVTLIEQSYIQVNNIITLLEQSVVSAEATQIYL